MPYNNLTNDLPAPPEGFADWRAAYAHARKFLKDHQTDDDVLQAEISFPRFNFDKRVGGAEEIIWTLSYSKLAHYAAREQAEHDELHPPLNFRQMYDLYKGYRAGQANSNHNVDEGTGPLVKWLESQLDLLEEREKKNR